MTISALMTHSVGPSVGFVSEAYGQLKAVMGHSHGGMRESHQSLYGRKTPRSLTGVPISQKFKKSRVFYGKVPLRWVNWPVTAQIGSSKICEKGLL